MNKTPRNPMPTEEQFRMRELLNTLRREEAPLEAADLRRLQHFVEIVRWEVVETPSEPAVYETTPDGRRLEVRPPRRGRAERVNYYRLNERGLKLLHEWERGTLDRHLD